MRYMISMVLVSLSMLLTANVFADPCGDAICSLAGQAGSSLGTGGILGLLVAGAAVLGMWFYRRRGRLDGGSVSERTHNVNV